MKKFADLPIYFILGGLILNIVMYFYNEVSFTNLMIRSSIIILLSAVIGYFVASALRGADLALSNTTKQNNKVKIENQKTGSTVDIRVNSEDDEELLRLIPKTKEEDFAEISIDNFKKLMNQD